MRGKKMKRRRDNSNRKITAFLSSQPPTKRAAGVEDSSSPSASSSEDQNRPTSSEQASGKGPTVSGDTAKQKTGYNRQWEADHTLLFCVDGEGMYCKLCQKFDVKNRQNQSKIWNTEPCTTLRKDMLARHEASAMHKEAVEQERACQIVKAQGGIREAVQSQVTLQRSAVIGAMKPLLSPAMSLGCSYLSALNAGGNAHYTSEQIVQELVGILA